MGGVVGSLAERAPVACSSWAAPWAPNSHGAAGASAPTSTTSLGGALQSRAASSSSSALRGGIISRWGPSPEQMAGGLLQAPSGFESLPAARSWDMSAAHAAEWKRKGVPRKVGLRMHAQEQFATAVASELRFSAPSAAGEEAAADMGFLLAAEDLAPVAAGGPRPSGEELWGRFTPRVQCALMAAAAAQRAWRAPMRATQGYSRAKTRDEDWADTAARALMPLLPPQVADALAGGGGGVLPREDCAWQVKDALIEKAGVRGDVLVDYARFFCFVRGFSQAMGWSGWPFPMQAGVFALLVRGKHAMAVRAAEGARGGVTVGDHFRALGISAANHICCPIEYDHPAVWGAAPSAKSGGGRQSVAATAPLKVSVHVMRIARGMQRSPMRFLARTAVFAEVAGARVQDAERVEFLRDVPPTGESPVPRGECYRAKQGGEPLHLFMAPRDYLGVIPWWEEHLQEAIELGRRATPPLEPGRGIGFPRWTGPKGCKSDIALATELLPEVATKREIRVALFSLWEQPPLKLGPAQRKEAGVKGHTLHGSVSDAIGYIGEHPVVPYELPPDLARGFSDKDQRVSGNWLREARQGPQQATQQGTAPAQPPGAPDARAQSQHVYGRGEGRLSGREQQIDVTGRATRFVCAGLTHWGMGRPLSDFPAGNGDWSIVKPPSAEAHA